MQKSSDRARALANEGLDAGEIRRRLVSEGFSRVEAYKAAQAIREESERKRKRKRYLIGYVVVLVLSLLAASALLLAGPLGVSEKEALLGILLLDLGATSVLAWVLLHDPRESGEVRVWSHAMLWSGLLAFVGSVAAFLNAFAS